METESSVFVLAMPGKNINSNMKTNDFQKEKKKYQDYIQVNIKPKNWNGIADWLRLELHTWFLPSFWIRS